MNTTNTRNIGRLYLECLNQGVLDAVDEVIAPSFAVTIAGRAGATGPDGFRELVRTMRAAFPDLRFALNDVLSDGDRVIVRWTMTGTHRGGYVGIAPTGRSVVLTGIAIYRMDGGRAVEQTSVVDRLGLLQQLGVTTIPSAGGPALETRA